MDYRQRKAIEKTYKKNWLKLCPTLNNNAGIYVLTRIDGDRRCAYVGQSVHLLDRLASHSMGHEQHIDKSLKAHKLYSDTNTIGWQVAFLNCKETELNTLEKMYIDKYKNLGYEMLNVSGGGQGTERIANINKPKARTGYRNGVAYGENKAKIRLRNDIDKYVDIIIKGKTNKLKERKLKELLVWINTNE